VSHCCCQAALTDHEVSNESEEEQWHQPDRQNVHENLGKEEGGHPIVATDVFVAGPHTRKWEGQLSN